MNESLLNFLNGTKILSYATFPKGRWIDFLVATKSNTDILQCVPSDIVPVWEYDKLS